MFIRDAVSTKLTNIHPAPTPSELTEPAHQAHTPDLVYALSAEFFVHVESWVAAPVGHGWDRSDSEAQVSDPKPKATGLLNACERIR